MVVRARDEAPPGWTPLLADMVDRQALDLAIGAARPDAVVHLAAQASVGQAGAVAEETWRVNAAGALNLAAAIAVHAPTATVLNVSSAEVYGTSFRDGVASESAPLMPTNIYGRSKVAAEAIFADVLPPSARLITARPFNHSGPGQDERFVLPGFAAQIARIEAGIQPPELAVGNLEASRDFLDVRDVVRAYVELLDAAEVLPARAVFNIASGQSFRVADMLDRMLRMVAVPITLHVDPARLRPADIPIIAGDASRLAAAVGWVPEFTVDMLVRDLLEHWRARVAADR
jgi:GDP-4-dehydro-6-deoxy-D-mannose reductase